MSTNINDEIQRIAISTLIRHKLRQDFDIFEEEVQKINKLDLSMLELEDIRGLSVFKNLEFLNLSCNHITDISELKYLTELKMLSIRQNEIRDISPLKNMNKLKFLTLSHNNIKKIEAIKNLKQLKELYLTSNEIGSKKDLKPLLKLPNLEVLNITYNPYIVDVQDSMEVGTVKQIPVLKRLRNKGVKVLIDPDESYEDSDMPYFENIEPIRKDFDPEI